MEFFRFLYNVFCCRPKPVVGETDDPPLVDNEDVPAVNPVLSPPFWAQFERQARDTRDSSSEERSSSEDDSEDYMNCYGGVFKVKTE